MLKKRVYALFLQTLIYNIYKHFHAMQRYNIYCLR